MFTKIDIVKDAFSQLRISGITVNPTPRDLELALRRFEGMMAWFYGLHLCVNYQFEENPQPTTEHGVDRMHHYMMSTNLATLLCVDFGKDIPPKLQVSAEASYGTSSGIVMANGLREVAYPNRMPRGEGQRRFNRWRRNFPQNTPPPTTCANTTMKFGDVKDIREPFMAYLEDELIASYTIEASDALTISNDVNGLDEITYRVTAAGGGENRADQTVMIVITTTTGRITTREKLFQLEPRALK